jgi:heme exporter protein D
MTFQFESFAAFMSMSGHGPFVWASYGITFVALVYLLVSPVLQRKAFFQQQKKLQRLAAANNSAATSQE